MKIAFDVSQVVYGTGVSVYTKNLIENLLQIDNKNDYILFGGTLRRYVDLDSFLNKLPKKVRKLKFPISPKMADFVWNRIHLLPIESLIGKIDVFHSSDWTQPPSAAYKVSTIHDLVPIKFPKLADPNIVAVHTRRLNLVKKEVDKIIVPSESTKKDLMDLGFSYKKIMVIPEAPDKRFRPASAEAVKVVKKKYNITGNYLLGIGANMRKNTKKIIEAFEAVKVHENAYRVNNLSLVITGYSNEIAHNNSYVHLLGHINDSDMQSLYSGAEMLVYPSLYEGFGIPILEAFACKTPVVTSNISSLPEVAGMGAVLVDPFDSNSIAMGILEAFKNKKKLVEKGSEQLKLYSWKKTAEMTLEAYQAAI